MMCVQLAFSDEPARLAARPRHRENLNDLFARGLLMFAGPWADDSGALLIFTTDEETVRSIVADDPYFRTAGVHTVLLKEWTPLVGALPTDPNT